VALREKIRTAALEHYALVTEPEVKPRHADPTWQGFVEPLSYGETHAELPAFLLKHFAPLASTPPLQKHASKNALETPSEHARILQHYRAFLLKDCGQMTIEGVRADMDTAQRRFDLERLLVPLKVPPTPPDIPATDPQREQKLVEWQKKNASPFRLGRYSNGTNG
jgi:hypothetical protein